MYSPTVKVPSGAVAIAVGTDWNVMGKACVPDRSVAGFPEGGFPKGGLPGGGPDGVSV